MTTTEYTGVRRFAAVTQRILGLLLCGNPAAPRPLFYYQNPTIDSGNIRYDDNSYGCPLKDTN